MDTGLNSYHEWLEKQSCIHCGAKFSEKAQGKWWFTEWEFGCHWNKLDEATAESLLRQIVLLDNDAHPGLTTWHDMRVRAHKAAEQFLGIKK